MTEKNKNNDKTVLSFQAPETRFPKAAVDFIDALLDVQRDRFDRELAAKKTPETIAYPTRAPALQVFADSDGFIGAGWSNLGTRRDGTAFRWMGRIGSLLLPVDLSSPRSFVLRGCGFTKRKFLKETTLWIDDQPVNYTLSRSGFNRWTFSGYLPEMPPRPFYLLRIQSPGLGRLAEGLDTYVSLAVSDISINC